MTNPTNSPTDRKTLLWKDEDEVNGIPIGPVWINGVNQGWFTKPGAIELARISELVFKEA